MLPAMAAVQQRTTLAAGNRYPTRCRHQQILANSLLLLEFHANGQASNQASPPGLLSRSDGSAISPLVSLAPSYSCQRRQVPSRAEAASENVKPQGIGQSSWAEDYVCR